MYAVNMAKVQTVREQAGVTFLPDDGNGPGIRWQVHQRGSARGAGRTTRGKLLDSIPPLGPDQA